MISELKSMLEKLICLDKALIVCIGSPLRRDDQAGLMICDKLLERGYRVVKCEYGLENCVVDLVEEKPKKMLIIDAVYSDKLSPGDIVLADEEEIVEKNISFITTHNIPINTSAMLLRSITGLEKYYLLGVRVKDIDIGLEVSSEVREAVEKLVEVLVEVLEKCGSMGRGA